MVVVVAMIVIDTLLPRIPSMSVVAGKGRWWNVWQYGCSFHYVHESDARDSRMLAPRIQLQGLVSGT